MSIEAQLESAIIELLGPMGYPRVIGSEIQREPKHVLIKEDLIAFLAFRHANEGIILRVKLQRLSGVNSLCRRIDSLKITLS